MEDFEVRILYPFHIFHAASLPSTMQTPLDHIDMPGVYSLWYCTCARNIDINMIHSLRLRSLPGVIKHLASVEASGITEACSRFECSSKQTWGLPL
jgi:hypothetical protein